MTPWSRPTSEHPIESSAPRSARADGLAGARPRRPPKPGRSRAKPVPTADRRTALKRPLRLLRRAAPACSSRPWSGWGSRCVFGYPGGAIMPVYDALTDVPSGTSWCATNRARPSPPTAMRARPARSASAWPPPARARPTWSPASPTPIMDSVPMVAITGQVATNADGHRRLPGSRHPRHQPAGGQAQLSSCGAPKMFMRWCAKPLHVARSGRPGRCWSICRRTSPSLPPRPARRVGRSRGRAG